VRSFKLVVNRNLVFGQFPGFHKRRITVKYVGIDLHKKTISIYVVNQERKKLEHKRLYCLSSEPIVDYFRANLKLTSEL